MRKVARIVLVGMALAAVSAPAATQAMNFQVRLGDITGEGGKLDKRSGQQWVPISSWFWGEYAVPDGAPKVAATLQRQGYYDQGSVRVNAKFSGCAVGKRFADAELKTPGARYAFTDVVITRCKDTSITFNYAKIRASGSW